MDALRWTDSCEVNHRKMEELHECLAIDFDVTGILYWVSKHYNPDEVFDEDVSLAGEYNGSDLD